MSRAGKGRQRSRDKGAAPKHSKRARDGRPMPAETKPPKPAAAEAVDVAAEGRLFRRGMFGVLAGAAVLRAIYLIETLRVPFYKDFLLLDSKHYKEMAEMIAAGDWLAGSEAYTLGPLYPYLLAVLQVVASGDTLAIFAMQQLMGLASLWLTGWIARACFGARAGIAAAALMALYAPIALMELKVMASSTALLLCLAALALLLRAREERWRGRAVLPGLLLGLACLARPNILLFGPVALLWLAWDGRGLRWERSRLLPAMVAGCGIALAIAPASLRNYSVEGELIPISSQGGITFYQSNNPRSAGTFVAIPGFSGSQKTQAQESKALAEKAAGRSLSTAEVSSFWFRRGLQNIREHPGWAAKLAAEKSSYWTGSQEFSTEYVLLTERKLTRSLWLMPLPFGVLLGFGAAGLFARRRNAAGTLLVLLFVLVNLATVMLFYFSSRYRLPAVPFLCVIAGGGVAALVERWRRPTGERSFWRVALPAGLVFVLSVIPWHPDYELQAANQFFNMGNEYFYIQRYEDALSSYRRALVKLDSKAKIHHNMGVTYKVLGRWPEAVVSFERVLELDPSHPKARSHLEEARRRAVQQAP
jgi:4-amino-4-deoxy-L-arabinose transferase-like glycosyltransferase